MSKQRWKSIRSGKYSFLFLKKRRLTAKSSPGIRQSFSLPEPFIYYAANTSVTSPRLYLKLVKTCKYFVEKNQILHVQYLVLRDSEEIEIFKNDTDVPYSELTVKFCVIYFFKILLTLLNSKHLIYINYSIFFFVFEVKSNYK